MNLRRKFNGAKHGTEAADVRCQGTGYRYQETGLRVQEAGFRMQVLILTLNAQHLSEYLTSDIRIFCRRPPRACVA
jgi:hypothetical protein